MPHLLGEAYLYGSLQVYVLWVELAHCAGHVPSTWMGSKLRYAYDRCLKRARHWRPPAPDRNAQTVPWVSRGVDLLREGILELETQFARLSAKAQRGVHSEERRSRKIPVRPSE